MNYGVRTILSGAVLLSSLCAGIAEDAMLEIRGTGPGRENRYATEALYKAVAPMLIPRDRRPVRVSGGAVGAAAVGVSQSDHVFQMMYDGMDLVLDEEYEEAIPLLETVLAEEPTMIPVWSTLGWTYWKVGRQEDALRLWQRLLRLDPLHPASHLLVANAFVGNGRLRDAEIYLKRSIELDPNQIEPKMILATVYRWTGRHQDSIDALQALLDSHSDRMDIQNQLALSLYENGNYDEALPLLEQGVRALPDDRELAKAHARCLLRTGNLTQAQLRARRLLRSQEADLELLLLLADAPRYQNNPEGALPYLRRIISAAEDENVLIQAHLRLIEISTRLWDHDPRRYLLDEALDSSRALLDLDSGNPAWLQSYGELLLRTRQYRAARQQFDRVMAESTTNVLAAVNGLFEVGQAANNYHMAHRNLAFIESINPSNPYLDQMRARLELSRSNMPKAYEALDRLERAGARGAVAVLHYSTLSDSDWSESMSVRRFRLQMLALKQAGYRFLTPAQIADYFADLGIPPSDLSSYVPPRAVIVTFDQANARTLSLATQVAGDLDLVFALNVPVSPVDAGYPGMLSVEVLKEYAATGRWVFGSMLYDAMLMEPVRPDGRMGSILANRRWLEDDEMYETEIDYFRRLRREYRLSRQRLREWIGEEEMVSFVAYPYGEYGQGLLSNMEDAIAANLNEAAINYEIGFTQSVFGYAVNGDNPLMYQRYSPGNFDTGADLLDHLAMNHPLFLARRMRAEFAALQGRLYRVRHNLDLLRHAGYPDRPFERVESFVYNHLALKFGTVRQTERSHKGIFNLELSRPFGGGEFDWFKDSLERRNWRTGWHAGIYLTPVISVEGRTGYGGYRQQFTVNLADEDETPVLEGRRASVKEGYLGVRSGIRYDPVNPKRAPVTFNAGLSHHKFSGDADFDNWAYLFEAAFRPMLRYDVLLRFEHQAMPSARSLTEGLAFDQYMYAGALRLRDWWDIWTSAIYYDIGDGNDRRHFGISSMWEIIESAGLLGGVEYSYVHSKHPKIDYWTPYYMNQWMVVGQLRNNFYRFYYDIALKFGVSKEDIRPGDLAAYARLVERANRFRFDPGEPPLSEWVEVMSASAAVRMGLGRYWQGYWEGSYTESVNYHEFRTVAGLSLSF